MLERQVDEQPPVGRQALVEAALDRLPGDPAGSRIAGEGAAPVAPEVARQLVEQQQNRQAGLGLRFP